MQAAAHNQYERMTVHVPRLEAKRFRAVVKALGFEIEKKNAIDRALDDIEGSIDELKYYLSYVRKSGFEGDKNGDGLNGD